jgi:hypothetical protein
MRAGHTLPTKAKNQSKRRKSKWLEEGSSLIVGIQQFLDPLPKVYLKKFTPSSPIFRIDE